MGVIRHEIETLYDRGDVVIFDYHGRLLAGVVCGYYTDYAAGQSVWYDIAISKDQTLDYTHGGDIFEPDILGKLNDPDLAKKVFDFVRSGEYSSEDDEDVKIDEDPKEDILTGEDSPSDEFSLTVGYSAENELDAKLLEQMKAVWSP